MSTFRLSRLLSHADVDFLGELKVAALLGILQQAAIEASTAAGFDAAWYARAGRIWIVRRTQLERLVPVGGGDRVEVETEVLDFRRARSLRCYELRRGSTVVARGITDWVYCDVASGRPVRIPEEMRTGLSAPARETVLPRPDSPPSVMSSERIDMQIEVQPSHLDHVVHVNNAVYVSFMEDATFALFARAGWPFARMFSEGGGLRIQKLDVEYRSDAQIGDRLTVSSWFGAEPVDANCRPARCAVSHLIRRADGTDVVRAASEWIWRRKPDVIGAVPE